MKINLSEIPEEGRDYHFDRETGEFNEVLVDLIGERAYQAEFTIRPIGNAYEIRGHVETKTSENCSRCGWEIEVPVSQTFTEILMEDQEEYRKSRSAHGNGAIDYTNENGVGVTFYQGGRFDAGEFVHEAVAVATPFYPTCDMAECEHLGEVEMKRRELETEFARSGRTAVGHPAFSALKALKSNFGPSDQ